jgi:hypothetical protein
MLQTIPARRYQSVDEVIQDLNQWQPGNISGNISGNPSPITNQNQSPITNSQKQSQSQIDTELNEIKTMFLSGVKPGNNSNSASQQPNKANPSQSKIDDELEEMRSKFLGNN